MLPPPVVARRASRGCAPPAPSRSVLAPASRDGARWVGPGRDRDRARAEAGAARRWRGRVSPRLFPSVRTDAASGSTAHRRAISSFSLELLQCVARPRGARKPSPGSLRRGARCGGPQPGDQPDDSWRTSRWQAQSSSSKSTAAVTPAELPPMRAATRGSRGPGGGCCGTKPNACFGIRRSPSRGCGRRSGADHASGEGLDLARGPTRASSPRPASPGRCSPRRVWRPAHYCAATPAAALLGELQFRARLAVRVRFSSDS